MYLVQFVGLTCFGPWRDNEKYALLPDGRFPDPSIKPHLASISVRTDDLLDAETTGWHDQEVTGDRFETEFFFPPSRIYFPSASDGGDLDATELDPWIEPVDTSQQGFVIDSDANWIGSMVLPTGTLQAFRLPGFPNDGKAPLLAQWTVPYEGDITIRLVARKGWPERTIGVRAGSEIAVINMSRGLPQRHLPGDHSEIYAELSAVPVSVTSPETNATEPPESLSEHPIFRAPRPADGIQGCSPRIGPTVGGAINLG